VVPKAAAQHFGEEELQSVLWVQNALEYRAVTLGTYVAARQMLDRALVDDTWTAVPGGTPMSDPGRQLAIILDLDETSLDNSAYEGQLLSSRTTHTEEKFNAFIQSGEVAAIPGALDFLQYVHSKGVRIFYISNQDAKTERATRANLARLGYPVDEEEDAVLTVNDRPEWSVSDKAPRRAYVAERYRVLLLLGDDLNDFVTAKTTEQREALFASYASYFGTKWFMIPNPMYGSWERVLINGVPANPDDRFATKLRLLRTHALK
jgi:acid phosphatase